MNAQQRRALILSRLPLIDSGGPVFVSLPPEAEKRTKSQTKAKRLRGRRSYRDGYIDVRDDLLHMVKMGLVKRERSGLSRAKRTHFVATKPSENPKPDPLELRAEIETCEQRAERLEKNLQQFLDFLATMPKGWLARVSADIGLLNEAYIEARKLGLRVG